MKGGAAVCKCLRSSKNPTLCVVIIAGQSGLSWAVFLVGFALGDNGGTETVAQIVGEFVKLGIAVNLDGFLSGIANYVAVVAPSEMILQFNLGALINNAIKVIG